MRHKTAALIVAAALACGVAYENTLVWKAGVEKGYKLGYKAALAPEINEVTFYPVVRVKDGDTLVVRVGEKDVDVRVLGINTPETQMNSQTGAQCHGPEASQRGKELLEGKKVRLEFDASQGALDVRGKRYLAYVWLEDGTLYQARMLETGDARQYKLAKKYERFDEFCAIESAARKLKRGLWASESCAAASAPPEKNRARHECRQ